ncbi:hypothetical protein A8B78_02870 [Jannaschia sp. EhC01]|nr:hypothetical protein A8B78_02870 [Jannaschia sp. EhC01]
MITRFTTASIAALLATGAAQADGHANLMGYALTNDGMTLVTMASIADPVAAMMFDLSAQVDAIAYRPVTGELLGFSTDGMIYTIDPMSGEMTDLEARFADDAMIAGSATAFDFNNAIDAVRAVGSDGANLVYFPTDFGDGDERANSVLRFTDAFYGEVDANAGADPMIFANAYTNAISGMTAQSTFQYALDAQTDALVSLANNAGELTTVAPVTVDGMAVDLAAAGGFDIVSPEEGTNMAYAILQMEGAATSGLYSIDLETAEATLLADLGMGGITGFAVSQTGM